MKHLLFLVIALAFFYNTNAQNHEKESVDSSKMSIKAGFLFNPQGYISLKHSSDKFSTKLPLYFGTSFAKNGFTVTPCYEFTKNSLNLFVEKLVSHKHEIGVYALFERDSHEALCNLGVSKMLHDGSFLFAEIGSVFEKWEPGFYLGVSIPFLLKIK